MSSTSVKLVANAKGRTQAKGVSNKNDDNFLT
jgi:hypothetical protein